MATEQKTQTKVEREADTARERESEREQRNSYQLKLCDKSTNCRQCQRGGTGSLQTRRVWGSCRSIDLCDSLGSQSSSQTKYANYALISSRCSASLATALAAALRGVTCGLPV